MWNCEECSEAIEDNFDACWNCGTARDGTPNPHFQREGKGNAQDDPAVEEAEEKFATKIAERFKCSKCEHADAEVKRTSTISRHIGLLSFPHEQRFVAVSCTLCGFTEFYDAKTVGATSFWDHLLPR
jgi:predicted nucleic-acid-binding Zn-ribbon protein